MIETFELISHFDNSVTEYVKIIHNEDEYTIMLKSTYEAQQVEHLTEIPTPTAE